MDNSTVNARVLIGSCSIPSPWAANPNGHGAGISALIEADGRFTVDPKAHFEVNPSFLAQDRQHGFVWAVSELEHSGELLCFRLDETGRVVAPPLRRIDTQSVGPCHVEVAHDVALVSHFHGGTISVIPRDADGLPTEAVELVRTPTAGDGWDRKGVASHPHAAQFIPGSNMFAVADHGRDLVALYRWNGAGKPTELIDTFVAAPGTAPRHLAWHEPSDSFFVSNEESGGVTTIAIVRDQSGNPIGLSHTHTTPGTGLGRATPVPSEVAIHPAGKYVVLANRFDDSLTIYRVGEGGALDETATIDSGGKIPRHFAFSPNGETLIVAHQDSDELIVFDWNDGVCEFRSRVGVATPTAVLFLNRMG